MFDTKSILQNSQNIGNIADFTNHKIVGGSNVFVCLIGENGSYLKDIAEMDNRLRGSYAYSRISSLPPLSPENVGTYEDTYNNWLRSFKRKADTAATIYNEKQSELTAAALIQTLELFRRSRKQTTDSIEKNFAMKLLFWYDFIYTDLVNNSRFSEGVKIVSENVSKIQEYLFYYMLSLTGADILLLQNKIDLDLPLKNLNVSSRTVLGHLGDTNIPKFTKIYPQQSMQNRQNIKVPSAAPQSSNVRVTIPPPPGRQSTVNTPTSPQQNNNIRITIPPRPGRQSNVNTPTSPQQNNNVRVTIPPRPGRQSNVNAPTSPQQNNNIRVTIPPRSGRQSNINAPTSPQQNNNIRVNIPPQPNRQGSIIQSSQNRHNPQPIISRPPHPQNAPNMPNNFQMNEKSYEDLARLASSVVQIFGIRRQIGSPDKFQILGSGSGIMISHNGYILTNFHVAKQSHEYAVRIENDQRVYFTNRIDRKLSPLPIYCGLNPLVRGQKVVAIGSPEGLFNTVSDGIISGFRNINGINMIQFTAPISCGSSGGAVMNMFGEVIGISTSGFDEGQNINFAVGYDMILNFARGII